MSDWDPQSCRACLETDVKLFHLHDVGLAELFGFIAGCPVVPSDGLPQHVCYYCRALLLKFKEFRLKCQNTMVFFRDVLTDHSRSFGKMKYCIPLSLSAPEVIDLGYNESDVIENYNFNSNFINSNNDVNWKNNEERPNTLCDIKNEDSTDIKTVHIKSEFTEEDFVTVEPSDIFNKVTEENIITFKSPNIFSEVSGENIITDESSKILNEETNILLHPKKERNVKARNTKRKRTETNDKNKQMRNTKAKKKKCNRYNEKFEEDFEEFSSKYKVKVVCLSKEEQLQKVLERKESEEYKNSPFSCDLCYKWFMSENAHSRHMMAHDPSRGTFVCEICQTRCSSRNILNRHLQKHKKSFICTLCGQVNSSSTRAKLHSEWHNGLKFNCQVCQKEFNAHSTYLNHMRESHKSVSCTDCGESFLGTNELFKHIKTVHDNTKRKRSKRVQQHFKKGLKLNNSAKAAKDGAQSVYLCEICAKSFPSPAKLKLHLQIHTGEKPYPCPMCPKSFRIKNNLEIHINVHTGDRPYKCRLCPETFKSCAQRYKHNLMVHTRERRYKCSLCDKAYVISYDLKAHVRYTHLHEPRPPRNRPRRRATLVSVTAPKTRDTPPVTPPAQPTSYS